MSVAGGMVGSGPSDPCAFFTIGSRLWLLSSWVAFPQSSYRRWLLTPKRGIVCLSAKDAIHPWLKIEHEADPPSRLSFSQSCLRTVLKPPSSCRTHVCVTNQAARTREPQSCYDLNVPDRQQVAVDRSIRYPGSG